MGDVQVYNVAVLDYSEDHWIARVIYGNTKLFHGSGFQRIKLVFFQCFSLQLLRENLSSCIQFITSVLLL